MPIAEWSLVFCVSSLLFTLIVWLEWDDHEYAAFFFGSSLVSAALFLFIWGFYG